MASGNDRVRLGLGLRVLAGFQIIRYMGLNWALFRLRHGAERKLGLLERRTPVTPWDRVPVQALTLASGALHPPAEMIGPDVVKEADAIVKGRFHIFSSREVQLGIPPDWFTNVLGEAGPLRKAHWTHALAAYAGDIKGVWELSRFGWAYALARAYVKTGDNRYPECFWQLFEDWCANNPPNLGANWACGQEATFRLMAVLFAAETYGGASGSQPDRAKLLARFVRATGKRIDANLSYALSQKNNHGISECVGLVTASLRLGSGQNEPGPWFRRGMVELERQLAELVYEDGSFSQHSLNYHRVLLHDLIWCRREMKGAGKEIPSWLDTAGTRALDFLIAITDPSTGRAPMFGANDGSLVLPLADCDFPDMRPTIQAGEAVFRHRLSLPAGPWDEAARWLCAEFEKLERSSWLVVPEQWEAAAGGYHQQVAGVSRLLLRCPTRFRHRPSQLDLLHVDIMIGGYQVTRDCGTYSYKTQEQFDFGAARYHNVLTVDGHEPMVRVSPFMYLPWPSGFARKLDDHRFCASHDAYSGLGVTWERIVASGAVDGFEVFDRVKANVRRRFTWHWLLADSPWRIVAEEVGLRAENGKVGMAVSWMPQGLLTRSVLMRADSSSGYGWWSPSYGGVQPAVSWVIEIELEGEAEVKTTFLRIR